jgi:hypothetical protein
LYNQSLAQSQNTLTRVHNGQGASTPGTSIINNKTYYNYSNITETTIVQDDSFLNDSNSNKNYSKNTYQNSNNNNITNNDDSRESDSLFADIHNQMKYTQPIEQYTNMAALGLAAKTRTTTVERTQSFDNRIKAQATENGQLNNSMGEHTRTQSFNGPIGRRIPENLKLNQSVQNDADVSEPSPALSTSSGPYIPISECFSGSPIIFVSFTFVGLWTKITLFYFVV